MAATRGVGARPRCPWWGNCCFLAGRGPTTPVTDLERRLRRAGRCGRAYDGVSSREFCRRVPALAWCFRPRQLEPGSQTAYIEGSTGGIWAGIHMYRAPVESLPKRKRQREGPYLTVAGLLLPCLLTPRRRTRRAEISPPQRGGRRVPPEWSREGDPPGVRRQKVQKISHLSWMVPISDRLSRLRRGVTLRATPACPRNGPASRHLELGMLGGRTHWPPLA